MAGVGTAVIHLLVTKHNGSLFHMWNCVHGLMCELWTESE